MCIIKKMLLIAFNKLSTFCTFEKGNLIPYAVPLVVIGDSGVKENYR